MISKFQIDVVVDLPVGKNLQNHAAVNIPFLLHNSSPIEVRKALTFEALFNEIFTGKGEYFNCKTNYNYIDIYIYLLHDRGR